MIFALFNFIQQIVGLSKYYNVPIESRDHALASSYISNTIVGAITIVFLIIFIVIVIKYNRIGILIVCLGLTATQIHDELTTAYRHGVVSYCTVTRWIQRFSNERESLEDNPRSGCPITTNTQQNIDAVKDLVNDDLHISIDYIATISDMSITCAIVMNV
ncbi:unnamed protein product [Rotaria sp. Silwood1]|nr:unnamed protein product [Rotaria sp. Silwood1]